MNYVKQYLPVTFILFAFNCNRKCDTYFSQLLTGKTEVYFGAYKSGNWWVYQNQNGTKRDSIYPVYFLDTTIKNKTSCSAYEQRRFTLHNVYLANMNDVEAVYEAAETTINFRMEAQNTRFPSFTFFFNEDLIRSFPSPDNTGNNMLDSLKMNGTLYYNILSGKESPNTYYFGKNRGLIGWGTPIDTFNLVNFQIQ
jgi:hypothetical protein